VTVATKKVLLAAPRGYCAGVDRAVITVEKALELYGAPVYVRKEIVHNKHVVTTLQKRGAVFVDETDQVPEGATVVFSAHGVAPVVHEEARALSLKTIDATCPLVTKVHREAVRFAADDFDILLIGHEGHEEVVGTSGEAPEHITIVDGPDDVANVEVRDPSKVVWLSQTTLSVDETMETVRRLRDLPEFAELRPSPLLLVAKALLLAVARHPMINSSWDEAANEIVVKHYVNLGIAAATDRGLIVPNVKDAHTLSLAGLARALAELTATAREGKSQPADLAGGTITITNVGVFGVDAGTPILTPGEAAILAFGQVREMPWVHEGGLAVRRVTTLSLSFDHRIVDGDLGSAVLRDVGEMLTDPVRMLAWC
jgi:hypothetical protein